MTLKTLLPGTTGATGQQLTLGVMGGGQLGRMFVHAAQAMGYFTAVLDPDPASPAGRVAHWHIQTGYEDEQGLAQLMQRCDAITTEFENVPAPALITLGAHRPVAPGAHAVAVAQDRIKEKAHFVASLPTSGIGPAPYAAIESEALLAAVPADLLPGILKTAREGYDGKGQWRVRSILEAAGVGYPGVPCVYEGFVMYEAEFSVILVRGQDGTVRFWDSTANLHDGGMLAQSILPAGAVVEAQVPAARQLAAKTAEALGYVGVLTLEFFATREGPVFNEMAPRVHNSGHWTIEGAATSQFENHIRAICGLPLGGTKTSFGSIEMRNIVGDDALRAHAILSEPGEPHLHLYGKAEAREGRKMGHVTRVGHALK